MGNLTMLTLFIVSVNVLLIMTQISAYNINPDFNQNNPLINCSGTIAGSRGTCSNSGFSFNGEDIKGDLPDSVTQTQDSGNFITDTYNTVSNWFKGIGDAIGLSYLTAITSGVGAVLKNAGVDSSFANLINFLWWAVSFIVVIAFIKGGDA